MPNLPIPVASFKTTITATISSSDTTIPLASVTDDDGNSLVGKVIAVCIDKGKANEETVMGTVDASGLTSVTRGLSVQDGQTSISGLKFRHEFPASVEVTSHPFLARLVRMMNNTDTIPGLLSAASYVAPVNDADYAMKRYVDTVAMAGTFNINRVVVAGTAGETVAAGNLIYYDLTDNEWKLCDADTATTVNNVLLGIAQGAGTDGNSISGGVLIFGVDSNQSGLTAGEVQFASNTTGGISNSAGTTEVTLGIAKSATELYFCPRFNQQVTEAQQDLLDAITADASEINKLDGYTGTTADLNEMSAIVQATDITGAELEDLSDGGDTTLHTHDSLDKLGLNALLTHFSYVPQIDTALWNMTDATFTFTSGGVGHRLDATAATWEATSGQLPGPAGTTNDLLWSGTKDYEFEVRAKLSAVTGDHAIGFVEAGGALAAYNHTGNHISFNADGSTLYATCANGTTATTTDISSGLTLTQFHVYKIIVNPGTDAKFYVNGVLKATLTTNLPSAANGVSFGMGGQTDAEDIYFHGLRFRQEL